MEISVLQKEKKGGTCLLRQSNRPSAKARIIMTECCYKLSEVNLGHHKSGSKGRTKDNQSCGNKSTAGLTDVRNTCNAWSVLLLFCEGLSRSNITCKKSMHDWYEASQSTMFMYSRLIPPWCYDIAPCELWLSLDWLEDHLIMIYFPCRDIPLPVCIPCFLCGILHLSTDLNPQRYQYKSPCESGLPK